MNGTIERLLELQALDGEIAELTAERDERPATLERERKEVAAAKVRLDAARKAESEVKVKIDKLSVDIAARNEQIAKRRQSTFAPKVGNKEYQALQNEIASIQAENGLTEEKILELMETSDELAQRTRDAQEDLADHEKRLVDAQRRVDEQVGAFDRRIAELKEQRAGKVPGVSGDALARYERVAKTYPGNAVVSVTGGYCQGCYMNVTMHDVTLILRSDEVRTCKSCQRILYVANPGDFLG